MDYKSDKEPKGAGLIHNFPNTSYTDPNHTLQEQVETLYSSYVVSEMDIERFNRFKSEMHFNLSKDKLDDYQWASKLSEDNILLLGIQLSTCAILHTQFAKFNLLNLPLAAALKENLNDARAITFTIRIASYSIS